MLRFIFGSACAWLALASACAGGDKANDSNIAAAQRDANSAADDHTHDPSHDHAHVPADGHDYAAAPDGDAGCVDPDREDEQACPHGNANAAVADDDQDGRFGSDFALAATARRGLSSAVTSLVDIGDQPVQVTGWVSEVCQRKGCWMVLNDGDVQARVLMKGHFSVPTDSKGRHAVVEGTLTQREFTVAQARHLADDGGQDPAQVQGPRTEYVLTATAVELLPRS